MAEGYFTPTKKKEPNWGRFVKTNSISPPKIIPGSPLLPGVGAQLIPGTTQILPPAGQGGRFELTRRIPASERAKSDPEGIVSSFESQMGQSMHSGEYYNPHDVLLDAYLEAKENAEFDWSTWDDIAFGSSEIDPKTGKRIGGGILGMLWEDIVSKPAKEARKDPLTAAEIYADLLAGPLKTVVRGANLAREFHENPEVFADTSKWEMLKLALKRTYGPELGFGISKGQATLWEGVARGTVDLGIMGQLAGLSLEAGDVGRAQLEVDKHLNIMAKRHWAKQGVKYDKTVNWLYGKPDLAGIPEEVVQSWKGDAKPKFNKLNEAKRSRWRILNILMTERERARTGKETQVGSWMRANGNKKGADKFDKKVVSVFAEQSSYFADPGGIVGGVAGMGAKVAGRAAGKGFLRRTTQKGMEGVGGLVERGGVALREAATSASQKAEQAMAKLVDDPDVAKLATQALPGRVGTLGRVGELTGTAIETAGQVMSSTGRIIGTGPGQRGVLGRIGQDKSVRLRHLIGAAEILDPAIDLGVNTMKAGGTGVIVGGGLGALTGEPEYAIAGAITGGVLGTGQAVPMHLFGVHQKAKQANDVKAWIKAKPEETRALLKELDFEQQLSMANVESLVKGVSDQAGAGDVDVRYVHGDDAEAIRHERGAWIGSRGELVVNLNHKESAGHTLAHEAMHALEDLPHEGMQERIAALNAKLFDTLDIDGNLLTKGKYSLDDEVSFANQYQGLLRHETIPQWRVDMGLDGTGRITKEQYIGSAELRNYMLKEIRAESFASLARSSNIAEAGSVKQRFFDHIMLAENSSKLARLRDLLMGQGVKFESDGAPSALFIQKTVLRKPSKPGDKGIVLYKPITNNREVNALLRDFVRVRRKIRQELAPEPGEEAGSSYTMKQLSEPGNERIAEYFKDNDTFAKDSEGNVLMAGGKPVRLSEGEVKKLQRERSKAMLGALDNVDAEGGLQRQELKNGKYEWVGHHFNDAQMAAMMALPNEFFAPSLKEKLQFINDLMQRDGETLLIDYNAALKGGKYSSSIRSAWRHDSPFGMRLTAARNLTITGFSIDRVLGKMRQWRGDKKGRFLDLWGGDYNLFKQTLHQYMDNHMNNRPGHTGLDADANTALHMKDRINELFDVPDSEAKRNLSLGVGRRPRLISSRRFDRINQMRDGDGNWHTDYRKMQENLMPAGKKPVTPKGDKGAQYMPAGKDIEVAPGLVRAKVDSEFKLSETVLAQYMPAGKHVNIMDYADRPMFTLAADNLVTGIDPLVGPTGGKMPVGVEAQGGRGFQFINPKEMIWAFKGRGTAVTLLKRGLDVSGGENTVIVGITSQGTSTHFNSPYGLYSFAKSLEAAANSKTFPQRRVDQHIKDLMTLVGRTKDDKFTTGQRNVISNIKGLAGLLRAVTPTRANPQGKIGFHAAGIIKEKFKQIGKLKKAKLEIIQPELEAAGLHLKELMHDLSDPGLRDAKIGDVVALVELDLTKAPEKTDFHFSYPWTIKGKPIGFLKKFPNVRDLTSDTRIYTKRTGQMTSQPLQTVMPEFNLLKSGDVSYMPAGKSGGEVFYSNSAKALESPKVPKAANGPAMLNAMIKGGANLQEMKWMGLDQFLMDHKGKVTKEWVRDFIDTNQIQVMEKVRGGKESAELERAIHDMEDAERTMYEADDRGTYGEAREAEGVFEAASERVRELSEDSDTLHGEGDLVLPGAKKGSYRELQLMLPRNKGKKFIGPEGHWGKDENIFASVRFNERTDADGKRMLFIEEVQSDWAAWGRSEGFEGQKSPPGKPVPAAPFVSKRKGGKVVEDDKWRALAFKRMLRFAADEGFDRVGWISGTDTAKRYDLSRTLNSVEWQRMPGSDTVYITALDKEGKAVIGDRPVNIRKLKSTVGRELSEKILASDKLSGEFTGLELEVGGEGHKQFYDVDLPNYVRKYVKTWGGEVGKVGIDVGGEKAARDTKGKSTFNTTAHYTDITPSMKQSVGEGQAMFMPAGKKGGKVKPRTGSATARKPSMRLPLGAVAKQLRLERDLKKLKRN